MRAGAALEIPVSCLEQGRWGHRQAYRRDDAFAAAPVRAAQHAGVTRSMEQRGSREGDQAEVWHAVDRIRERAEVESSTTAAAEVRRQASRREPTRAAAVEELAVRGPLPGQCGPAVTHDTIRTGCEPPAGSIGSAGRRRLQGAAVPQVAVAWRAHLPVRPLAGSRRVSA